MAERARLMGLPIDLLSNKQVLGEVEKAVREGKKLSINFLNAGKYIGADRDPELKESLLSSGLLLADGMPVVWAARGMGLAAPERVAGIDLMERILKQGRAGDYSFYLLGARQEVLETAARRIRERYPAIKIAGMRNGYFSPDEEKNVVKDIAGTNADVLFVAMGTPQKELFISRNFKELNVKVAMGVGGSLDVIAGLVPRAPLWMQKAGLEWFYRFLREPGRMWKRYLVGNSYFIWKFAKCRLSGHNENAKGTGSG